MQKKYLYIAGGAVAAYVGYRYWYANRNITAAAAPGKRPDDYRYFYRPGGGETMARPANEFTASEVANLLRNGWREAADFTSAHKGAA